MTTVSLIRLAGAVLVAVGALTAVGRGVFQVQGFRPIERAARPRLFLVLVGTAFAASAWLAVTALW